MDPQKNVNPAASDEDKETAPQTESTQEPTTPTTPADISMSSDPTADAAPKDDETAPVTDTTPTTDATAPTDVVMGGDQSADTPAPADVNTPAIDPMATSPATPTPDQQPADGMPTPEAVPTASVTGIAPPPADDNMLDPQTPLGGASVTPADNNLPATAPAALPHTTDKKTIFILLGVAVVLIAAIAVLYFM